MKILFRTAPIVVLSILILCTAIGAVCTDGHVWGDVMFSWAVDLSSAEASRSCSECGVTQTAAASVNLITQTDATCTKAGSITKIASVSIENASYSEIKTSELTKLEHHFTAEFSWLGSSSTCLASLRCTICDKTESIDCTVTSEPLPPDGNGMGGTVYTATVTVGNQTFSSTKTVPGTNAGHNYSAPAIRWSEDYQTAEAYAVCTDCPTGHPSKTISVSCTVTVKKEPATTDSDGWIRYTASAEILDRQLSETKTVVLPRIVHKYTIPEFRWEGTLCHAYYTCISDGDTFLKACDIKEEHKYNDCTQPGILYRTASITIDSITYTDRQESPLPAKGHVSSRLEGKAPTCTEDGISDGIICADCGTVIYEQTEQKATGHTEVILTGTAPTCLAGGQSDGSICAVCNTVLKKQTELPPLGHTPVTQPEVPPTCTEPGQSAATVCAVCETILEESTALPATGHRYASAAFFWSPDSMTAYASKTCTNGCGFILRAEVTLIRTENTKNGVTVTKIEALAVFPDGTSASSVKTFDPTASTNTPNVPSAPSSGVPSELPSGSQPATPKPVFADVVQDSYYADAVVWAAASGITQGTASNTFSPDMECTRAQVVTMLWRAAHSAVSDSTAAFADVPITTYYYKAVVWAAAMGITAGTAEGMFSPDLPCSRAQIVTMLWRAAGCPTSAAPASFSDVRADAWYADAVAWAVASGITRGTGDSTFSPDAVCTRAQIVTFLYRADAIS